MRIRTGSDQAAHQRIAAAVFAVFEVSRDAILELRVALDGDRQIKPAARDRLRAAVRDRQQDLLAVRLYRSRTSRFPAPRKRTCEAAEESSNVWQSEGA